MGWKRKIHFKTLCGIYWLRNMIGSRNYCLLKEDQLRACRKTDTVFIFGSGYSLHDITPAEWTHIEQYNPVGFSWFVRQDFVRVDFHLIREIGPDDLNPEVWRPKLYEYGKCITQNPHYTDTVFIVQGEYRAIEGNRLISLKLLPEGARVFRFHTRSRSIYEPPSFSFAEGFVHGPSSLFNCVNFAYILGWKRIILTGVDLYDRRYFWLKPDETRDSDIWRGASYKDTHNTAQRAVEFVKGWKEFFAEKEVELMVYNTRSLLAEVLPVYQPPETVAEAARNQRTTIRSPDKGRQDDKKDA